MCPKRMRLLKYTSAANEALVPVRIFQGINADPLAAGWGVDETIIAKVNAYMGNPAAVDTEKHQITWNQVIAADWLG